MNAATSSATLSETAPDSPVWTTLAEMKEAHWALLEGETANNLANVRSFLAHGVALGRRLSLPGQRGEAQQLLDYWVASMRSLSDDENDGDWTGVAVLDKFDSALMKAALDEASGAFPAEGSTDEEATGLRRLVMQLVRLNDDGHTFSSAPQKRDQLLSSSLPGDRELREKILGKLLKAGIVTESGGMISLVDVSVLYSWDRARGWVDRRRELRSAARFWISHSRNPGALLVSTDLIEEAESCRDRNELEEEFTRASRQRHGRTTRRLIGVLSAIIAVLVGLLGVAIYFYWKASKNEREARQAKEVAEQRLQEAEAARSGEKAANDSLPRKQNQAVAEASKRTQDEVDKLRQRLEQQDLLLSAIQASSPSPPDTPPNSKPAWLDKAQSVFGQEINPATQAEIQQYAFTRAVENSDLTPELKKTLSEHGIRPVNFDYSPNQEPPPAALEDLPVCAGAGLIIKSGDKAEVFATAGVFVQTAANEKRLLLPGFLLTPGEPNRIDAANWQLRKPTRRVISNDVRWRPGDDDIVAVPVSLSAAWNVIPVEKSGESAVITRVREEAPASGAVVKMITQRAGMKRGKVVEVVDAAKGLFHIKYDEKEFQPGPGDAGAPILTEDNAFLAIHTGRDSDGHFIARLAGAWMKKEGLRLASAAYSPEPLFKGAMVQVLVSSADPALPDKAKSLLEAASRKGLLIPDKAVLVRRRSPDVTEVRYYYEDLPGGPPGDKALADGVAGWLDSKGIKSRTYHVADPEAPRRMIQVALALKDAQFLSRFAP